MMNLYCNSTVADSLVTRLIEPAVTALLRAAVPEISCNGDGLVFVDYGDGDMRQLEAHVPASVIHAVIRILTSVSGQSLDPAAPFLSCELACGARFHGVLPPSAKFARCSIRGHARLLRTLSEYMTPAQVEYVRNCIQGKKNILVSGATNAGKSTLLNAMIAEIPVGERLAIIEHTPELQVRPGNVIYGLATDKADLKRQVKEMLRDRPDRIIIGEVRGAESWDMIDALRTGHSGGFATIHADSAAHALTRLAGLAGCDQAMIAEAIHIVLHLEKLSDGRRAVIAIKEVRIA